jgi:hypothetical protein
MAVLDRAARKAVQTITRKFGQTVTLREVFVGKYQTASSTPANTQVDYEVKAIVAGYSANEVSGVVQGGDKLVHVAAADLENEPEPNGK